MKIYRRIEGSDEDRNEVGRGGGERSSGCQSPVTEQMSDERFVDNVNGERRNIRAMLGVYNYWL